MKAVGARYGIDFDDHFAVEQDDLRKEEAEGFVEIDDAELRVVGIGRLFVRNVAMVFDEYLGGNRQVKFSRTV